MGLHSYLYCSPGPYSIVSRYKHVTLKEGGMSGRAA
jgi:hypothetical protein